MSRRESDTRYFDAMDEDDHEPQKREVLPYFIDPKQKLGVWKILKDIVGKDLTRIALPVYFNDPLNVLQRMAAAFEYNFILDLAATDPDPVRRVALLAIFQISSVTNAVKTTKKPFNPLLGETYELVDHNFKFFSE